MHTTVTDIMAALDAWAPQGQKADFDRVGLQVGRPNCAVGSVLVALDLTAQVIDEAAELGVEMIVTHHPLLFQPLARLTDDDPVGSLAMRLAEACISYAAIHTNLDAAWDGVSFALADQLGLTNRRLLAPLDDIMRKVVVFVPADSAEAVRSAMSEAGAGQIGAYSGCSFSSEGTGRFTPGAGADPTVGAAGGPEEAVAEVRMEAVAPSWAVGNVIRAIRSAHPYEEPATDVYAVHQPATRSGYGVVGELDQPEPLNAFLRRVASKLGADSLRYVGADDQTIKTVAVCGGSGMSFMKDALRSGADAFVTADITYHRFFEALDTDGEPTMALIDAGHYETEAITEQLIVDHLATVFPDVAIHRTKTRTSPIRSFCAAASD